MDFWFGFYLFGTLILMFFCFNEKPKNLYSLIWILFWPIIVIFILSFLTITLLIRLKKLLVKNISIIYNKIKTKKQKSIFIEKTFSYRENAK